MPLFSIGICIQCVFDSRIEAQGKTIYRLSFDRNKLSWGLVPDKKQVNYFYEKKFLLEIPLFVTLGFIEETQVYSKLFLSKYQKKSIHFINYSYSFVLSSNERLTTRIDW